MRAQAWGWGRAGRASIRESSRFQFLASDVFLRPPRIPGETEPGGRYKKEATFLSYLEVSWDIRDREEFLSVVSLWLRSLLCPVYSVHSQQ